MNIVFVTPEYVTEKGFDGGLANYLFKISSSLVERGHKVFVIVSSDRNEKFVQDNINIIRVEISSNLLNVIKRILRGRLNRPLGWLFQSWKLNQTLRKLHQSEKIDIAQFASYTGTAFFRPSYIPSISRISSYQPLWDKAYGINPSINSIICNNVELYALKISNEIYGPSELISKIIENKLNRKVKIIETPFIINKKVNSDVYTENLLGKKYLLFFGTLGELKGLKEIAEILYSLFSKYPNISFVFVGKDAGYNGSSMIKYIFDSAREYKKNCIYLGAIKQEMLKPIIDNAEAVVLPSRIDNLPNTCIESMANGKVVIGTKGASFEQLIDDKHSGFLCEINNYESLYKAIEGVLNLSPSEKGRIERAAVKRMEQLNPTLISEQLEDFYQLIIGKHET